jgi:hypothetical protein
MSEETGFNQMAEDLFNGLGVDATFIPKIGDSVALKVNYDQTVDYHPDGYAGNFQGYLRTIEFIYADIGKLPAKDDCFLIGTTRFEVQRILDHEGGGRFVKAVVI